jgi:hypothetical protein
MHVCKLTYFISEMTAHIDGWEMSTATLLRSEAFTGGEVVNCGLLGTLASTNRTICVTTQKTIIDNGKTYPAHSILVRFVSFLYEAQADIIKRIKTDHCVKNR